MKQVLAILLLLLSVGCVDNSLHTEIDGAHFEYVASYPIPDTSTILLSQPLDAKIDSSGNLYYTDMYLKAIIKTSQPFTEFAVFGSRGIGPGEYSKPANLSISRERLYFSDRSNPYIKSLPLEQDKQEEINYEQYRAYRRGKPPFDFKCTNNH